MTAQQLIVRDFHGVRIRQRHSDGYLDATAMCKANGKRLNNYLRTKTTKEFLTELSDFIAKNSVALFGVTEQNQQLIHIVQGGTPREQGTWVHPYVAINLAQWCSAIFAVMVTNWMFELLTKGTVSMDFQGTKPPMITTLLIPTDIAKRVGLKNAKLVNLKLIELGLQTKHRDKRLYYKLTEAGLKHGQYQDTGKPPKICESTRAIRWYKSVLTLF